MCDTTAPVQFLQVESLQVHRFISDFMSDVSVFLGPLGGVKNLRVTDPTMTSLTVNWDPADGAVRLYKVFYIPVAGGLEEMVRLF